MLEFLYDYFKPLYPDSRVLYTDTDSFILDIPTEDFYKDMMQSIGMKQSFDMKTEGFELTTSGLDVRRLIHLAIPPVIVSRILDNRRSMFRY
ncbi:hypothetical protein ACOMHN_043643 [Nucella lapillus]